MFKKILIANRGEIAVRIIRACRELEIIPAVIFSPVDRSSLAVKLSDEAYLINLPPRETYLNFQAIIEAAKKAKAEAIHPGYGFLAENFEFANFCEKEGIIFIGPKPKIIKALGDKNQARDLMEDFGLTLIPGTKKALFNLKEAEEEAKKLNYPLLIKASLGGGGRGMRKVNNLKELRNFFPQAQNEAKLAFGSEALYLEKYLEKSRHIEFQILADNFGNAVHLGERECSIQRRFQKIIEESPSSFIDQKLRLKMGETSVEAFKKIGYNNLGTIEFLVDQNKKFYFLEVNTRIQVEHPLSEEITGLDLLKEQIRISADEELNLTQSDIKFESWAFESRITCENPFLDFIPDPGQITHLRFPGGIGIRIDSAIYPEYLIPREYDSLIAKLISKGKNREEARLRMIRALKEFEIGGIYTTIPFHLQVFSHPEFLKGNLSTHFIEDYFSRFKIEVQDIEKEYAAIIAALESQGIRGKIIPPEKNQEFSNWNKAAKIEALRK